MKEVQSLKKTKDTAYLYLSSNIRAQESRMVGQQALSKMMAAKTPEEAYKTVTDAGIGAEYDYKEFSKALDDELESTYERLEKSAPDPEIFKIFRYKYDGHNLKTIVKAHAAGIDPMELMMELGTVSPQTLVSASKEEKFTVVEPRLAEAYEKAKEVLAKTSDPQMVDVIIDKAVLEEMVEQVNKYNSPFLKKLVYAYIDIANIRSFIRIKRIGKDLPFLKEVIAQGGQIPASRYYDLYLKGFDDFFDMLSSTTYGSFLEASFDAIKSKGTLSTFEKLCDNYTISLLKESRFIPFGIEPVLSYLLAKESEVQAIRIVMASKLAGVAPEKIAERLRDTYA